MRSRLSEFRRRLRCSVSGVTSRWIFGALECVLPLLSLTCGRTTHSRVQRHVCKGPLSSTSPASSACTEQQRSQVQALECHQPDCQGDQAVGDQAVAYLAVGVDVLPHVVILGQVEQLPDLGRALGAPQPRLLLVRQPRQLLLACRSPHADLPAPAAEEHQRIALGLLRFRVQRLSEEPQLSTACAQAHDASGGLAAQDVAAKQWRCTICSMSASVGLEAHDVVIPI